MGLLGGISDFLGLDDLVNKPQRGDFNLPGFQDFVNRQQQGSDFRGDQRGLVDLLQQQAQGQGPGQEIVRQQVGNQVDRGVAQQQGLAAGASPANAAMASRTAAQQAGDLQAAGARQAGLGGLQAQLGATQQLGSAIQQGRSQDLQQLLQELQARQAQQRGGIQFGQTLAGQPTGAAMAAGGLSSLLPFVGSLGGGGGQ